MRVPLISCESPYPVDTQTDRLNALLKTSGEDYVLSLCPGDQYFITAPLLFAAPNQEISTAGYPTDSTRATLVVSGSVADGVGHTTAVDGTCAKCDGVKLRNVQVDGARRGDPPTSGGANIEMGGRNANQLVEYVRSFDPRSWSCLHVAQGNLDCTDVVIQNNDIGPAGSDKPGHWADGISVACRNSVIRNNRINNPTDGGIVLFGSPGSLVENNSIRVETQTLLGGINMVDVSPFGGDYKGVVVKNNTLTGGFASHTAEGSETTGMHKHDAVIKVGIAIGPRTWFGDKYINNVSTGGTVQGNRFTGAFSYGIAMSSATNFTVQNNVLIGNTSFVGVRSSKCSSEKPFPSPAAFVMDAEKVQKSITQSDFRSVAHGDNLISCVAPPAGGYYWPFKGEPIVPVPVFVPSPVIADMDIQDLDIDIDDAVGLPEPGIGSFNYRPAVGMWWCNDYVDEYKLRARTTMLFVVWLVGVSWIMRRSVLRAVRKASMYTWQFAGNVLL